MDVDLGEDLKNSPEVIKAVEDYELAKKLYAALCNMDWEKSDAQTDEDKVIEKLKGESRIWSCSWRYAGGVVAQIRRVNYNKDEDYMDYYCTGFEGYVAPAIRKLLATIGWKPMEGN